MIYKIVEDLDARLRQAIQSGHQTRERVTELEKDLAESERRHGTTLVRLDAALRLLGNGLPGAVSGSCGVCYAWAGHTGVCPVGKIERVTP